MVPAFGTLSAARHAAGGAHELDGDGLESLRTDVEAD